MASVRTDALPVAPTIASTDLLLVYDTLTNVLKKLPAEDAPFLFSNGSAETRGASPSASASANVAAIQAVLDNAGFVSLTRPGTYEINDTLVISSNTHLHLGPGVTIKQSASIDKAMLINAALIEARTATVTIAWTAGVIATVTWTAHGFDSSDYVAFQGANQTEFNNVFRVNEVIDANTFTIRLHRTGSATGSGTITGYACDKNIVIEGGTWDYNYAENDSAAQTYDRHAVVMAFCGGLALRDCKGVNVYKYAFNTCACADYKIERISGHNCAEILKTYGPLVGGYVNGLYGDARDDAATVQAKEPATFIAYQAAFGDIHGFQMKNVDVSAQGPTHSGAIVLYASDNEFIEGVSFENINAYAENGNGISVKNGDTFTGSIDSVRFRNINSAGKASTNYPINIGCNARVVSMDGYSPAPNDLTSQLLRQESSSTIKSLRLSCLEFSSTAWPSSTSYVVNLNGSVMALEIDGCAISLNSSNGRFLNLGTGTFGPITFRGCDFDTMNALVNVSASGANTRMINLVGCRLKTVTNVVQCLSLTMVNLTGNLFDTISNAVVRVASITGKGAIVSGEGNQFISALALKCDSASQTLDVVSLSIPVDPAATGINATAGNMAKRLATGRVMRADGSAWADI